MSVVRAEVFIDEHGRPCVEDVAPAGAKPGDPVVIVDAETWERVVWQLENDHDPIRKNGGCGGAELGDDGEPKCWICALLAEMEGEK